MFAVFLLLAVPMTALYPCNRTRFARGIAYDTEVAECWQRQMLILPASIGGQQSLTSLARVTKCRQYECQHLLKSVELVNKSRLFFDINFC